MVEYDEDDEEPHYGDFVGLANYRSCTWREKREVLDAFWRTRANPSEKINRAALEYGPYAVACIFVIGLELVPVIIYSIERRNEWCWLATASEVLAVVSLWWAWTRNRALRARFTNPAAPMIPPSL